MKPGCTNAACKLCCRKMLAAAAEAAAHAGGETPAKCPVHKFKPGEVMRSTLAEPDLLAADAAPELDLRAARCQLDGSCSMDCEMRLPGRSVVVKTATSRVLLIGTGADELLGGYGRHRTAREKRGAEGVKSEMLKDLERLWTRNLGRDDRIIADHGREARHPFLDDDVLRFVGGLPIELLAFGPGGEAAPSPDKWMLRTLAAARGLGSCARFKKRAIQFGTRIAKQSNVWHAGSNRQITGDMAYFALASTN